MIRRFMPPGVALLLVGCSLGSAPPAAGGDASPLQPAGGNDTKPPAGAYSHLYDEPAPINSRLIEPLLPQSMRHFALSRDRRRVAYSEEGKYQSEVFVATLGADARKVGVIPHDPGELQWAGDGHALLYLEAVAREAPGEFSDWDLPRGVQAYRLMRLPVDGGGPHEVLRVERPVRFQASPTRNEVFFSKSDGRNLAYYGAIRRLDLETGRQEVVMKAEAVEQFAVSPDGARLMVVELDPDQGREGTTKVLDLTTKAATIVGARPLWAIDWAADGQSLLVIGPEPFSNGLALQRFPVSGRAPERKVIQLSGSTQVVNLGLDALSPDGRRIVAYARRSNIVISLETGETKTLDSFGYIRCWLDDRTVMGAYRGGQYAVDVPE